MKDVKYLFAYSVPLATWISLISEGVFAFTAPLYTFVFIPLLEAFLQEFNHEYSESDKQKRAANFLFDVLLYLNIPLVFGLLLFGFTNLQSTSISTTTQVGYIISMGILLATNAINVAHELGHRSGLFQRSLAKLLLLPCLYMHFYLEHNFGHHKNVATPEDPATSIKNQSLYSFWVSSVFLQYRNAWRIQRKLLKTHQQSFFSIKNDMLWYHLFQVAYLWAIFMFFGTSVLFIAVGIGIISFLFLETINYIEHYGLRRKKNSSGRYERVQTHHSWNSNHFIGRIVLYELTRHSDHHFKAAKKYQTLEHQPESPQLPFGYPTAILVAFVPPLWFAIMNPRLAAAV